MNDPHDSWNEADFDRWRFYRWIVAAVKITAKDMESFARRYNGGGYFTIRPHQRDVIEYLTATGSEAIIPNDDRRFFLVPQMTGRGNRATTTIVDEAHDFKLDNRDNKRKSKTPARFEQGHPKRFKP